MKTLIATIALFAAQAASAGVTCTDLSTGAKITTHNGIGLSAVASFYDGLKQTVFSGKLKPQRSDAFYTIDLKSHINEPAEIFVNQGISFSPSCGRGSCPEPLPKVTAELTYEGKTIEFGNCHESL